MYLAFFLLGAATTSCNPNYKRRLSVNDTNIIIWESHAITLPWPFVKSTSAKVIPCSAGMDAAAGGPTGAHVIDQGIHVEPEENFLEDQIVCSPVLQLTREQEERGEGVERSIE